MFLTLGTKFHHIGTSSGLEGTYSIYLRTIFLKIGKILSQNVIIFLFLRNNTFITNEEIFAASEVSPENNM